MLQEQTQLLQNMLGTLTEALKAVNARLDQQADANRKTFADQKLLIDNLTKDLGVVREKVDDNNVRVGSLVAGSRRPAAARPAGAGASRRAACPSSIRTAVRRFRRPSRRPAAPRTATSAASPTPTAIGTSPTKAWEQAYGDYAAGLYDLAVDGFTAFIRDFPKHDQADDAQFLIGRSYLQDAKNDKAVEAFDKVIRTYPMSNSIPDAYYLKGVALRNLQAARQGARSVGHRHQDLSRQRRRPASPNRRSGPRSLTHRRCSARRVATAQTS